MSKLFTLLLEYRGGTYIDQLKAADPREAITRWCGQLSKENLAEWRLTHQDIAILQEDAPVPLDGLSGAWCACRNSSDKHLMLLNIVATDQSV